MLPLRVDRASSIACVWMMLSPRFKSLAFTSCMFAASFLKTRTMFREPCVVDFETRLKLELSSEERAMVARGKDFKLLFCCCSQSVVLPCLDVSPLCLTKSCSPYWSGIVAYGSDNSLVYGGDSLFALAPCGHR